MSPASPSALDTVIGLGFGITPAAAAEDQKPTVKTLGFPNDFDDACEKGIHCVNKWSMETAVWYFREALTRFGAKDVGGQGFAQYWMGYALNILGQSDERRYQEALTVAEERYKKLPDPASLAIMGRAAYGLGDLDRAKACVKEFDKGLARWRDVKSYSADEEIEKLRSGLETRTYELTWLFPVDKLRTAGRDGTHLSLEVPQSDLPYQTLDKVVFDGVISSEEKSDPNLGYKYYDLVVARDQPVRMTVTFTQRPCSYRSRLPKVQDAPLPDQLNKYLGMTAHGNIEWIMPAGGLAARLASTLRGPTAVASAVNVMHWCNKNWGSKGTKDDELPNDPRTSETGLQYLAGHCENCAIVYVALFRACGVPARLVRGIGVFDGGKTCIQHTIPEYYINGLGWIPYQPGMPLWVFPTTFVARAYYAMDNREGEIYWKLLGLPDQTGINGTGRIVERHLD